VAVTLAAARIASVGTSAAERCMPLDSVGRFVPVCAAAVTQMTAAAHGDA